MKSKKALILSGIVICLSLSIRVFSQNQPPVVDQVTAIIDTASHTINFTYSVFDQEQDTLEVFISLSNDGGETFMCPMDSLSGDIGWPVLPGEGKMVIWQYDPDEMYIDAGSLDWYKAKIIADDRQVVDIQELVDQVDSLNLVDNMRAIVGIRHYNTGAEHLANVKQLLKEKLSMGNSQLMIQEFPYSQYNAENIIGMMPGQVKEEKLYILDGHFDTVFNSPGADDNGSAVAGLLEAARILSPFQYRHSLQFIAFDLEEPGMVGSEHYIQSAIPSLYQLQGVVNFEMIGYYSTQPNSQNLPAGFNLLFPDAYNAIAAQQFRGNFLANVGNAISTDLIALYDSCAAAYVPQLLVHSIAVPGNGDLVPDLRRSDHASFWDAGYKALMLTDGGNLRNPNYHSPADTMGTLNFTFMTNVVKAAVATIAKLGGLVHCGVGVTNLEIAIPNNITGQEQGIPTQYRLQQNYPNPFNPQTRIDYFVPKPGYIDMKIYSITGQEMQTLVHKFHKAGAYSINFNAASLPCGLYLYTLQSGDSILDCKKMLLIK